MMYFYVLLLKLVAYLEGPQKIVSFIFVFCAISYSTLIKCKVSELTKITKYNFGTMVLIIAIIIHGLIFGTVLVRDVAVLLTYWIWFVFTYNHFKNKSLKVCLRYIFITFLIFNITNFIYYKLYFADQKLGINGIMSIFGYFGYRIYFPLSSGHNIFASQIALNSVLTLFLLKNSRNKIIYFICYTFYIYVLILADSRLMLLFSLLFSVIYWFSFRTILTFFKKFWWLFALVLFIFLAIFYGTDIFSSFKRPGELDSKHLNRIEIWSLAAQVFFNDFHFITGYGLNGFQNNLPEEFQKEFKVQYLQTSHNFIFQNLIDFGLIGITIIVYLMSEILKMIKRLKSQIITILFVMFLFMGITESIPSFYSFESTLFFISIFSIILVNYERKTT